MSEPRLHNTLAAIDQVLHVVQCVEISDSRCAVFLEELGVKFNDVGTLAVKTDHIDAAREGLQIGAWTGGFPECVHHIEGILVAVEECRLEQRSPARLKVCDACFGAGFHNRHIIFRKYARAVRGLKPIPECGQHEIYLLHICFL